MWLNSDLRIVDINDKSVKLLGRSQSEYREQSFLELLGQGHAAVKRSLRSAFDDSAESLTTLCAVLQTEKKGRVPVELTVYPLESGERLEIGIVSREEVESNRQSLSTVYELSRKFIQTRERSELARIALTAIIRGTDFIAGGIYLYEREGPELRLVSTEGRQSESEQLAEIVTPGDDRIWTAFEAGKNGSNSLHQDVEMLSSDQRTFVTPIGSRGVLVAFVDENEHLDLDDFEHTDGILSSLYAAIERTRTEEELEEQRQQAQEQSEQLRKLTRLNGIIRDVNRAMVNANDVSDLHREVPVKLSGTPPYKAA